MHEFVYTICILYSLVCDCVEARGRHQEPLSTAPHLVHWGRLSLSLFWLHWLSSKAPKILLSPFLPALGLKHVMSSWALGGLWGCRSSCFCSITISRTLSPVPTTWRFSFHSLFLLTICLRNPSSIFIFHEWQSLCLQSRRTSLLYYLHPVLQPGLCFKAGEWVVATPPLLDCFLLLSQCWCGFSITVWEPLIVFAWVSCISWRESGCLLFSLMWEMPHRRNCREEGYVCLMVAGAFHMSWQSG